MGATNAKTRGAEKYLAFPPPLVMGAYTDGREVRNARRR